MTDHAITTGHNGATRYYWQCICGTNGYGDTLDEAQRKGWEHTHALGTEKGTLAIDFDDTLTTEGGIEAIVALQERGYGIIIHTANADITGIQAWIQARWPLESPIPDVTWMKPQAIAFIDDKAIRFTSWSHILEQFQ